jgi:class 3 adenylate cyclase/tetratricopeptide (TPR) repeat protein
MAQSIQELEAAIAALEAKRLELGPAVVETAVAALRERLANAQQTASPSSARLKQVSTLFVDVVGSTAIGQRLTPEEISAVMDGALARFAKIVDAHRGRVLQYTGDGMLAAFGADDANEDDVEAAVRAGLAIVEDAGQHADIVRTMHGVPEFNVRAGIHTGRVLLGAGVDVEGSIRGAAVNLAARMEQTAAPGSLRISHDTYRHVSGLFDVIELPSAPVKGVEQPVRSYIVERARPRAFRMSTRGVEGLSTPMVGRAAELACLLDAFNAVCADSSLRVVTIVGDAGLGKSRLVAEFQRDLSQHLSGSTLLGRSQPRSVWHRFGLLRELLFRHFRIDESGGSVELCTLFSERLGELLGDAEGEATAHVLGQLIGLDFSKSVHTQDLLADESKLRARGFAAGVKLLRRLAGSDGRPAAMLLDDIHWSDEGSLAFVRHLIEHERDVPLLCVLLTRPSLFDSDARWATTTPPDQRIDLRPLDEGDREQLADLLLRQIVEAPRALHTLVNRDAEGNPFYMEELVKMLLDDGVIVVGPDGWRVTEHRLSEARVPQTLTGVLQARIDAIEPTERTALQQASVVGAVFDEVALATVDPLSLNALPALLRRELIRPSPTPPGASREFVFAHHLLHQVTYDSVLRTVRLDAHSRLGVFWRSRAEVATPGDVNLAACRALTEAHGHGAIVDQRGFVEWFEGQFMRYRDAYVSTTLRPIAESVVELANRHCGPDDPATARALTNLARVAILQGQGAAAEPFLRRALAIQEASQGADHPDTARTIVTLGGSFQGRGDMRGAEHMFRRALAIRERVYGLDHPLTIDTVEYLAHAVSELGQLEEAESLCRRALEVHERTLGSEAPTTASAMTGLAAVLVKRGDATAAEGLLRRALAVQQGHLPPRHPDLAFTMWHLAESLRVQGKMSEAEPIARETLSIWEETMGADHEWTAWGLDTLARVRLQQGDRAEATDLAERALLIFDRVFGSDHPQVTATLTLLI